MPSNSDTKAVATHANHYFPARLRPSGQAFLRRGVYLLTLGTLVAWYLVPVLRGATLVDAHLTIWHGLDLGLWYPHYAYPLVLILVLTIAMLPSLLPTSHFSASQRHGLEAASNFGVLLLFLLVVLYVTLLGTTAML